MYNYRFNITRKEISKERYRNILIGESKFLQIFLLNTILLVDICVCEITSLSKSE